MTVGKRERRVRDADAHASDVVARLREVEYHPVWRAQGKSHDGAGLNRFVDIVGNGKDEVVPQAPIAADRSLARASGMPRLGRSAPVWLESMAASNNASIK